MRIAGGSAKLKHAVLPLAAVLFLAFTAEYGHLVEESVAHAAATGARTPAPNGHRCHNCVTSQPQIDSPSCSFQASFSVLEIAPIRQTRGPVSLALRELPANRAPPSN
ncbi:MAG TPA: hypothetical protein VGK99_15450 [Acidobacteriota bacterium]|jgi:hypothetical protein